MDDPHESYFVTSKAPLLNGCSSINPLHYHSPTSSSSMNSSDSLVGNHRPPSLSLALVPSRLVPVYSFAEEVMKTYCFIKGKAIEGPLQGVRTTT